MATARQVLTIGGISFLTAGLTYCLYFDYKRRNDPVFRKKLLKEQLRLIKKTQVQDKNASRELEKMLAAAVSSVNAEPLPTTVEGKEQFFMEQVGMGEMLASKMPQGAMPAAIAFFKAYKVYPSPQELMIIYQRTMPAEIFAIIVEMIKLDVNHVLNAARNSYSSGGNRRQAQSDGPVIEEITGEERAVIDALKSITSTPTSSSAKLRSTHPKSATVDEQAPKSSATSPARSPTEEPAAQKSQPDGPTVASSSKAPSENGSLMATSQTANSFVLVDEESPAESASAAQVAEGDQANPDLSSSPERTTSFPDRNTPTADGNTHGDTSTTDGNTSTIDGDASVSEDKGASENPSTEAGTQAEVSAELKEQQPETDSSPILPVSENENIE